MTSATEPVPAAPAGSHALLRVPTDALGGFLCVAGFGLLWLHPLPLAALGIECLAVAFWWWSRAAADRVEQIPRWAWLRRPALALWLAAAVEAASPGQGRYQILARGPAGLPWDPPAVLGWLESLAILWAGLELMAALPQSRPFPELPGPLPGSGPWLPIALPAAGFLVLWRQAPHWLGLGGTREIATALLLLAATVATLRALGRRSWTASLRWLAVSDCALAASLLALGHIPSEIVLVLWAGCYGGRAALLAGELRGSAPRRGPFLAGLWRLGTWVASASLAWPVVAIASFRYDGFHPWRFAAAAIPVVLSSWLSVHRLIERPERRKVPRRESVLTVSHVGATVTLATGPLALLLAWWSGFEASWPGSVLALLPGVLGGCAGLLARRATVPARVIALSRTSFGAVTGLERRLVRTLNALLRAVATPARDLHTGDAQEYLLFLAGVAILMLVFPLLR